MAGNRAYRGVAVGRFASTFIVRDTDFTTTDQRSPNVAGFVAKHSELHRHVIVERQISLYNEKDLTPTRPRIYNWP